MPRLLYVVYNIPHIPAPGASTRAFHLVTAASCVGPVTLVGVVEPDLPVEPSHLRALAGICGEIITVPAPPPRPLPSLARSVVSPLRRFSRGLSRHLPGGHDPVPSIWWRFDARPLRPLVARLLAHGDYDLLIVEHAEIASALCPIVAAWGGASLADLHNVISVHQERMARMASPATARAGLSRQDRRTIRHIRSAERGILRTYSRVSACSRIDAVALAGIAADARLSVVPNGVAVDYFRPASECAGQPDHLIFTGALWYQPNVDGLRFFLDGIWPRIRAHRPSARLSIVGSRPSPEVIAMGERPGVTVFGSVPDVRPHLAEASVAVVPLRLGSGTRLKILEALAARRPVVATALGAEGLDLVAGRDLLIADDADAFAAAVLRLLEHPEEARLLAARGHTRVCEQYDWSTIGATFRAVLRDVLASARPHPSPSMRKDGISGEVHVHELQLDHRPPRRGRHRRAAGGITLRRHPLPGGLRAAHPRRAGAFASRGVRVGADLRCRRPAPRGDCSPLRCRRRPSGRLAE